MASMSVFEIPLPQRRGVPAGTGRAPRRDPIPGGDPLCTLAALGTRMRSAPRVPTGFSRHFALLI